MIREEDQVFAKVVARHNLLPPEAIAEGLRALETSDLSLQQIFIERGLLTSAQVRELDRVASRVMQGGPIPGYDMVQRIGRGGMGAVYKARQLSMGGRTVALKVVRLPREHDRKNARRLLQEAKIVGKLDHPNIVKGYDVGVAADYVYFVMELIEGQSLRDILQQRRLEAREALILTRQVASALAHAHDHDFVHRDVKPGNILLTREGVPKLTDLGLAKSPHDSTLTRSGATLGTPQYISPEQAKSPRAADARSDIYSLGATLYHMVTGVPPYQGDTLASMISQVLFEPYVPPEDLNPDLSAELCLLIDKMMVKDPDLRYADAGALIEDIDLVLAGEAIAPVPTQVAVAESRSTRLWVPLVALLVALAAIGYVSMRGGDADDGGPDVADRSQEILALETARAIRDADRAHPISSVRSGSLFDAVEAWSRVGDAYPDDRTARIVEDRMRELEARFDELHSAYSTEELSSARNLVRLGQYRQAREELSDAEGRRFRERFARSLDDVPEDWREPATERAADAMKELDADISTTLTKAMLKRLSGFAQAESLEAMRGAAAVSRELDANRDLLGEAQQDRIARRITEVGSEARNRIRTALSAELDEVASLVAGGEFREASLRLDEIDQRSRALGSFLDAAVGESRRALEAARRAAVLAVRDGVERDVLEARDLLGDRRIDTARDRLMDLRQALEEAAAELGTFEAERARVGGFLAGIATIAEVWDRVRERLATKIGEEVRLGLDGRPARVTLLESSGDRIRFRTRLGAEPDECSLHEIRRRDVLELGSPRGDAAAEWCGIGWFLLAEAWSESNEFREALASRAEASFARGREEAGRLGIETGAEVFAAFLNDLRSLTRAEAERQRAAALASLEEADALFEQEAWPKSRANYLELLEDPASRRALLPSERDRAGERAEIAGRKIRLGEVAAGFAGRVEFLDEKTGLLRVTYSFDDAAELTDWDHGPGWEVVDGVLWETERDREIRGRKGLVYKREFETLADLTLAVDLVTVDVSPPPFLYLVLVSLHENSFGWMYSESGIQARQLNFFAGPIDEFEDAFLLPDPTAGARLGHRPPAGLVRDVPALRPGERKAMRFELSDRGRDFRFRVDGQTWYERPLGSTRKRGPIEIRTYAPHGYERIVLEGKLRR